MNTHHNQYIPSIKIVPKSVLMQLVGGTTLTLASMFGSISAATAAPLIFTGDQAACEFPLQLDGYEPPDFKVFQGKNGKPVRLLSAGRGLTLTFTNLDTNASLTVKPNGSVSHITVNRDGTLTWVATGHNVLIYFPTDPTDKPIGPATIQYVGRIVFTTNSDGSVFNSIKEISGKQTDICAALSG